MRSAYQIEDDLEELENEAIENQDVENQVREIEGNLDQMERGISDAVTEGKVTPGASANQAPASSARSYRTEEERRAEEHQRAMDAHARAQAQRDAWIQADPLSVAPAVREAAQRRRDEAEAARKYNLAQETQRVVAAENADAAAAKYDYGLQGKLADADAKVAAAREAGAARIGAAETREQGAQARADAKNATTLEQQRMKNQQARETEAERSRREAEKIAAQQQMEKDKLAVQKEIAAGKNAASMSNSGRAAIARIVSANLLAYPGDYKMAAQSLKQMGLSDEDIKAALDQAKQAGQ